MASSQRRIDFDDLDPDALFLTLEFSGGPAAASLSAASSGLARRVRLGDWSQRLWRALSRRKYGDLADVGNDDDGDGVGERTDDSDSDSDSDSDREERDRNVEVASSASSASSASVGTTGNDDDDDDDGGVGERTDDSDSDSDREDCDRNVDVASSASSSASSSPASRKGEERPPLADGCPWFRYYRRRASLDWDGMPTAPSSLDLIQEEYRSDAWKLISTCALCSRTSGSSAVRAAIASFHIKYPTPTDAARAGADPDSDAFAEMAKLLLPLGLRRERVVYRLAREFLNEPSWRTVADLFGCGAFAEASHRVFCRGEWRSVLKDKTADRNVRAYAALCAKIDKEKGGVKSEIVSPECASSRQKTAGRKRPQPSSKKQKGVGPRTGNQRRSKRISAKNAAPVLGTTIALSLMHSVDAEGMENFELPEWENWAMLAKYLLALTFVVLVLHFLLYSPLCTYALMRRYLSQGGRIPGEVLSCDPSSRVRDGRFELAVLYRAVFHRHAGDARMKFRYPDSLEEGRYLRRFESESEVQRGTTAEILLLPGEPRSGLTRESVERTLRDGSPRLRAALLLLPGSALLGLVLYGAIQEVRAMEDPFVGWIVLGLSVMLVSLAAVIWSESRWRDERRRRFWSAVPTKVVNSGRGLGSRSGSGLAARNVRGSSSLQPLCQQANGHGDRTEPLLAPTGQSIPVVVGQGVTTIPMVKGTDVV